MAQSQRRRPRRGRAVETLAPTLTVLGSSCSIPRPARASSSYLFEAGRTAIVADLGTGAFANLVCFRRPETIDAIVISHMHADHFIDLVALRYALRYGNRTNHRRLPLYLPPGGERILRAVVAPFSGETGSFLDDVYDIATYEPGAAVRIGDVTVTFAKTDHFVACYAMRFDLDGLPLAYSADSAPCETLDAFARGADVLLCEATLSLEEESCEPRGHLSAREAGRLAAQAGVKSLLLSHYPASADPASMKRLAAAEFGGSVRVVDDADRIALRDL